MKKIMLLFLTLMFVCAFAGVAMAEVSFTSDGPDSSATLTGVMSNFKTSNNVTLTCASGATAYAASSAHLNGDKAYGAASGDSIIYWTTKTEGADTPTPGNSDGTTVTTWSAL